MKTQSILALCVVFLTSCQMFAPASELPDFVVFLADDLSARDVGVYGGTNIQTPNIDALAESGMVFDAAFVASPSCAPSRAALMTGLMPARNGAEENHTYPHDGIGGLPKKLQTLGYQTAAFGKVAHSKSAVRYGFDVIEHKSNIPDLQKSVSRFLKERTDTRPLALFVGTSDPHVPWPSDAITDPTRIRLPPTQVDTPQTRVQRSRYLQEVINLDAFVGEVRTLCDKHLSEAPVFGFSSDHGSQFPFSKWTLYDEGIRIPLIFAWPGKIEAGSRTDAMVSWVDLLPTLIDLAGGQTSKSLDGKSFADVLLGRTDAHRDVIYTTHSGDRKMNVYLSRSVRTPRYKLILNLHPEFAFTTHIDLLLRETSGDYFREWTTLAKTDDQAAKNVARHHGRPAVELFDLQADPYEMNNLADQPEYLSVKQRLTEQLEQWMETQGDQRTVFHEPLMLDQPETWIPRRHVKKKR